MIDAAFMMRGMMRFLTRVASGIETASLVQEFGLLCNDWLDGRQRGPAHQRPLVPHLSGAAAALASLDCGSRQDGS